MKLSRRRFLLCASCLAAASAVAACAPASGNGEPQPPEIVYGQDLCAECGMIISEPRFASATLLANGEYRKFDDIGDLVQYHSDHPDQTVRAYFAHDYRTEEWIRAETAFYVQSPQIDSPMGHGVAAFAKKDDAQAFAQELGTSVLNFDEMRVGAHMNH